MKKIYTFYEKCIYSANSVIFLLKSCFFFLLLSIFVNVIINDLFNLDIASNSTASSMKKYSKWVYMLVIVFIIPVFETVIYQWLPVFIYTLVRPNNNKEYSDLLFSFIFSIIFGLLHIYSLGYFISAFVIGFCYISFALFLQRIKKNYFVPIFLVHLFNNLFAAVIFFMK